MVAELVFHHVASAEVEACALGARAATVAAADHVREVEALAGEAAQLGGDFAEARLELLALGLAARGGGGVQLAVAALQASEDRPEAVVFALRNGVELVVVATGAVDGDAHRGGENLRDHVVEIVRAGGAPEHVALGLDLTDEVPRAGGEEAGRREKFRVWSLEVGGLREHVSGDLFTEELVIGLVGVEGGDDVVAIAPGVGAELVALKAVGVRVVRNVQPMAGPALAVVRAGEQAVHKPGDSAVLTIPLAHFLTCCGGRWEGGRVRK